MEPNSIWSNKSGPPSSNCGDDWTIAFGNNECDDNDMDVQGAKEVNVHIQSDQVDLIQVQIC